MFCALPASTGPDGWDCVTAALILYLRCRLDRLWRYTGCGIGVADPGAVPGASTKLPIPWGAKQARRAW